MAQLQRCPRNTNTIHSDSLSPWGQALATGARGKGNGGGDPELAADMRKGTHGNGNSEGGPALTTDARCNDNRNGDVQGGPTPTLGKETLYGMNMAAGAVADGTKRCHKQGSNKRRRPRHQAELRRDRG